VVRLRSTLDGHDKYMLPSATRYGDTLLEKTVEFATSENAERPDGSKFQVHVTVCGGFVVL
jgi:hypothetical protein